MIRNLKFLIIFCLKEANNFIKIKKNALSFQGIKRHTVLCLEGLVVLAIWFIEPNNFA